MAKIKIKLNSKRSTTIRATDGAYYKLRAGENIIELEPDAYAALMAALGLKPNNKKQPDPKPVEEPPAVEQPKEQCEADKKQPAVDEQIAEQTVCAAASDQALDNVAPEINSASDELDSADGNDTVDNPFAQMSYPQLKAAYKEITGKNSKLRRNELINFLQEHHNAE